ncbi:MAG: CoA-acylating methylmalonate-semialdehyde dehydrogenase [Chloroflexi bacterium]|nr:CoA-acylating methylmalonate-semialdehyde dehydrogenase [Chloroflexota bacterium]
MRTVTHYVNGQTSTGSGGRRQPVFNPATGERIAEVVLGTAADVDHAVESAARGAERWGEVSLGRRQGILFRFRELMDVRREDLAKAVTREHGKVLDDARGEVARGLEVLEFACGIPHLLKGDFSENVSTGVDAHSIRQPLGVVAGITPFNFPVMVPMWMLPVALACGNAFVLKPSEKDPTPSLMLAEMATEAGIPDGVLNVVQGDAEVVDALLVHEGIAAISFVGSTPVARHVYRTATDCGKRVQALGGAKNHLVVMPDADPDLAADALVSSAYGSAGERCMAISVGVLVGSIGDEVRKRVQERASRLTVTDGSEDGADMGPLINRAHLERVAGLVAEGEAEGAELVLDGRGLQVRGREGGFFLGPCLFDHVTPEMEIYRQEVFGPVLSLVRVDTSGDALGLVNRNHYGNGLSVFTDSGAAARYFTSKCTVGMIGINVPIPVPMAYYSFGGWNDSLFGANHIHGPDGVAFYTKGKAVTVRWPQKSAGLDMGFTSHD